MKVLLDECVDRRLAADIQGHDVTIQDVFEAVGKHASGKMTNAELKDLEDHACPGPGAC